MTYYLDDDSSDGWTDHFHIEEKDPRLPFKTKGLMGKQYLSQFVQLFKEYCDWYIRRCLSTKHEAYSDKINPRIWSFERFPSRDACVEYVTRARAKNSLVLWRDYIISSDKCRKYIDTIVNTIEDAQSEHLKVNDAEMNRIISTLVNELTANEPPKKPKSLADFIKRIPFAYDRAIEYRDVNNLGSIKVAYEPFAANTIKGTKTIREWYDHYVERFEDARLSIQQEKDQTYKRPKQPKPKTPKEAITDERPVHDKDTLAYPFKSKLKEYRRTVDANVPYIEPPEQPHVQYELLHRPYFSHEPGCWEIDHAFNVLEEGDKWMFAINVNTRYLVVYRKPERAYDVWQALKDLRKEFNIKSIRGDGSTKYCPLEYQNRVITPDMLRNEYESGKLRGDNDTDRLMRWYMNNDITIYFNSSPFTLHNKIVDVVIKTIRNAIGYRRLKPSHMDQLVDYYNNTVHKSIGCTPAFMQEHPEVEYQYIRWCERKLSEIIDNQKRLGYLDYKPGNVLMVHIDKGKTSEKHDKRRRFFDKLGVFVRYDHGNVVVDMLVKGVRVHSTGDAKMRLTVPVYHTKFVSKTVRTIPPEYKDYYINSMKALEVDDIYNGDAAGTRSFLRGTQDEDKNKDGDITPITPA